MLSARNSVGFVSASEAVAKAVASEYNKMHSVAYQRTASFLVGSDEIHVIVKLLLSETSQQPSRTKTLPRVVVDGACGDSAQRPSFRLPSSNTPTSPLALSLPPAMSCSVISNPQNSATNLSFYLQQKIGSPHLPSYGLCSSLSRAGHWGQLSSGAEDDVFGDCGIRADTGFDCVGFLWPTCLLSAATHTSGRSNSTRFPPLVASKVTSARCVLFHRRISIKQYVRPCAVSPQHLLRCSYDPCVVMGTNILRNQHD